MNEDLNGNRKLFWYMEGCSRIKDGNGKLSQGEDEV